jgi:predicted O-methyltransferase YrrM
LSATSPTLPRLARELRYLIRLRVLPWRVALFDWRAHRLASRIGDRFSLVSATRPEDLALLLGLARGRLHVVELGTGTGWTALALALHDARREVITYDPVYRPERNRYLELVDPTVRQRITFVEAPGSSGPPDERTIDLLYVDSTHGRQETIEELRAWRPALAPEALVVLDDFNHPDFPGVREAVHELGLSGQQRGTLFVHEVRHASDAVPASPLSAGPDPCPSADSGVPNR